MTKTLEFKWTISKARDSYRYNICTLYVNGRKVARTCGGGYDMKGTVLGDYIAREYSDRLLKIDIPMSKRDGIQEYYGLTFHDPNFDPGKAEIDGETVEAREAAGKSFGLERYQQFYRASSKIPTKRHSVPLIDGACGFSSVEKIMGAVGLRLEYIPTRKKHDTLYILHDKKEAAK